MTNTFMNGLKSTFNYTFTENGAITHKTTGSNLLDMFALGGAYRSRSDEDVILLFHKAYMENPIYALKCLFYLRDVRGGQGERRFFRVCLKDIAMNDNQKIIPYLVDLIPEYGRWDDLYTLFDTPAQTYALAAIKKQLELDVQCKTPSLLAKWMKSENTSSADSRRLGNITRTYLGLSHKQYRRTLSILRERIKVLEKLMSENRWDEIEFDKIPSRAGMIYRNAFACHDIIKEKYRQFANDTTTTVNAKALYPYEVVHEATKLLTYSFCKPNALDMLSSTDRAMINKYWDNLADYFNDQPFNGIAVVDTSGSMTGAQASAPINVAISLGMYCAEKAKGPFAGHYISFSRTPKLIEVEGIDFVDKVKRIYSTNLCENTNIEATFDLLLTTAKRNKCKQEDLPKNIIIISDMEFDAAVSMWGRHNDDCSTDNINTLLESVAKRWEYNGYKIPHLIFWNVDARHNNIPMRDDGNVSFVSGFSPSIFEAIMSGKTGYDLMLEKLNSARYQPIETALKK